MCLHHQPTIHETNQPLNSEVRLPGWLQLVMHTYRNRAGTPLLPCYNLHDYNLSCLNHADYTCACSVVVFLPHGPAEIILFGALVSPVLGEDAVVLHRPRSCACGWRFVLDVLVPDKDSQLI